MESDPPSDKAQLDDFVRKWEAELPLGVAPVVQEHYMNLIGLASSLKVAGHTPEGIRLHVRALIASYEQKLLQAIEAEKNS